MTEPDANHHVSDLHARDGASIPEAIELLIAEWRERGEPAQRGIEWPRARWIEAFPAYRACFDELPRELDRRAVRAAVLGALGRGDALAAFLPVMAWGYGRVGYGPHRVQQMLAPGERAAAQKLAEAASVAQRGDPVEAYRLLDGRCRLDMLGPAFGTKFLYFVGGGALILDRLVADGLKRVASIAIRPTRWDDRAYSSYLEVLGRWADGLRVEPDVVEQVLFTAESTRTGNQWGMGRGMTTSARIEPERDLEQAVDAAIAEGLSLLDVLTDETDAAYAAALASVDDALAAHGDSPGTDVLAEFQRSLAHLTHDASERLHRQHGRLATFNLVLFGRTGAGKSSLIEALSGGTGAPISQGESDWTTDVREVRWGSCRLFDTPGIAGWGRTMARSELEARAEAAVADADVVLLCFDTQSQQEGEFGKVAEWIARYGKPAVALLNSRNGRWRFPPRVARPSARRQLSRSVQEHAANIRDELANIGLADVPVIAIHSKRAAFARTIDPYEGPDAASRKKLRDEVGPERLLAWSNLSALERLLSIALRGHAEELRLGMLREQTRGMLHSSVEEIAEQHGAPARVAAEQLERGVADVLALLGRPSAESLASKLETLEALRGGGFAESAIGEAEHHTRTRLSSRLRSPRSRAIRRAERFVEQAFAERRDADAALFEQEVLTSAITEVETVASELGSEIAEYLAQRLRLIAGDVSADVAAAVSDFSGAGGSAGRTRRQWGVGAEVTSGLVAVGSGAYVIVAAANSWNLIGWTMFGAIAVAGIASKLFGGKLRKQAAAKREQALASARAEARRSVIDTFEAMEEQLVRPYAASFATAATERLADEVDRTVALRRVSRSADQAAAALSDALGRIAPGASSTHVLADTARLLQRTIHAGASNADRLLFGSARTGATIRTVSSQRMPSLRPLGRQDTTHAAANALSNGCERSCGARAPGRGRVRGPTGSPLPTTNSPTIRRLWSSCWQPMSWLRGVGRRS